MSNRTGKKATTYGHFQVSVQLNEQLENAVAEHGFASKSDLIRCAIRAFLAELESQG